MESLYFPLFLVVMAVLVIWLYYRSSRAYEKHQDEKAVNSSRIRRAARKRQAARSRPSKRAPGAGSASAPNKVWSNRRRHARHKTPGRKKPDLDSRIVLANHLGPDSTASGNPDNSLLDQEIPDINHVSFDEHLAHQRAEAVQSDEDAADKFTMSAIKCELTETDFEEEETGIKRSRFKP